MPEVSTQTEFNDFQDKAGAYLNLLQFWHGAYTSIIKCEHCGCRYDIRNWALHKKKCKTSRNKV